jgi:hypothetical protein
MLEDYFIHRFPYPPPSLTTITNPLTSADLTSRSSRSKTRRNQAIEQEIPAPASKYLQFMVLVDVDLFVRPSLDCYEHYILQYPLHHID